jgi:capsid protein
MTSRIHPLTKEPIVAKPNNGVRRREVDAHIVRASYDAARSGSDLDGHWLHADAFDADSANSREVRQKLVRNSRYEHGSNGYYAGIVRTHTNMIVGVGPTLRMLTGSTAFNQLVEREWYAWSQAMQLRRKLWCMSHARTQDGEAFAVLVTNPNISHTVTLDMVLIETEQCQTPYLPYAEKGYIDGIRFDEWNNPIWYDVLPYHPGSSWLYLYQQPIQVPADQMLHWFKLERPGQHRSIPELTPTLPTGAMGRRFREATVASAETAASISALIHSKLSPASDEEPESLIAGTSFEIQRRMAMALPTGWDVTQMRGEHPNAQYNDFNRALVSEQARPISMPYNAAACDSSTYSFASGKLDTLCYRSEINVERVDCNDLVLDPLFAAWFREWTIMVDRRDIPPAHQWDWPAHPVIDSEGEGRATDMALRNGMKSLRRAYSELGMDYEDELQAMAEDYGVTVDEMREILLKTHYPAAAPPPPPAPTAPQDAAEIDTEIEEPVA